jgi:hypothetical protein
MKTVLALFALLAILSYSATVSSRVHREKVVKQTFTIYNESVQDLGYDTVYWSGGSVPIDLPSSGTYIAATGGSGTAFDINGTTLPYPGTGTAVLPNGGVVQVQWNDANDITITDVTIIQ